MRRAVPAMLAIGLFASAHTCPDRKDTPPETVYAVILLGPSKISISGGTQAYTVQMTRSNASQGFATSAQVSLVDDVGTLLSLASIAFPAGQQTVSVRLDLGCNAAGSVQGTATSLPDGTPNSPTSSRPSPVSVHVRFQGMDFDGAPGNQPGNPLAVSCVP